MDHGKGQENMGGGNVSEFMAWGSCCLPLWAYFELLSFEGYPKKPHLSDMCLFIETIFIKWVNKLVCSQKDLLISNRMQPSITGELQDKIFCEVSQSKKMWQKFLHRT